MILPVGVAEKLLRLIRGESIPASQCMSDVVAHLIGEGLILKTPIGRTKYSLRVDDAPALTEHLATHYSVPDLSRYIATLKDYSATRSELAQATTDSKAKAVRSFSGFLVNVYEPVAATINGEPCLIKPQLGRFQFIHDFQQFRLPENVTVVGVENPENFRMAVGQQYLFEGLHPLFISRYPQNNSRDLISWLKVIPNSYLHFGDFDFAGINIYLTEYRRYLGEKATFFIPPQIEILLKAYGNRQRYDNQQLIKGELITEPNIDALIFLIHKYKAGLDQEILINPDVIRGCL